MDGRLIVPSLADDRQWRSTGSVDDDNIRRGVADRLSELRAQVAYHNRRYHELDEPEISDADFDDYDMILAMDWDNLALLQAACPPEAQHKLQLVMSFAADPPSPVVPDPYHGGAPGFDEVINLLELAAPGLLHHARRGRQFRWCRPCRRMQPQRA